MTTNKPPRYTYRIGCDGDSTSSQRVTGTYDQNSDVTRQEIERAIKGTFGGRFVRFGNGQFEYIAYTD